VNMKRLALWILPFISILVWGHAHATEAMDLVDRTTLNGTWEGFDAAKGYLVLLRVDKVGPAILVLIHADMPSQPTYRFEIGKPQVTADGHVELVGNDQERGLRIRASGRGRAGGTIGLMSLRLEWLKSTTILVGFALGELEVKKTVPTLAREMAKAEERAVQRLEESK